MRSSRALIAILAVVAAAVFRRQFLALWLARTNTMVGSNRGRSGVEVPRG